MIRAEQALHEILSIAIDEEPEQVLMLKARVLIDNFKAGSSAYHRGSASTDDIRLHVTSDLAKLRDAVDREIDRRVNEDLADTICDLLEHLSNYLHEETGTSQQSANKVDASLAGNTALNEAEQRHRIVAEAAYLRAAQRHFEPGHDLEDWLAAESALKLR